MKGGWEKEKTETARDSDKIQLLATDSQADWLKFQHGQRQIDWLTEYCAQTQTNRHTEQQTF